MPLQTKRLRIPYAFHNAELIYSTNPSKREIYNEIQSRRSIGLLRKMGVYIAPEIR